MKDNPIGQTLLNDRGRIQAIDRFLPDHVSEALFPRVLEEMQWHQGELRLFGRRISTPRLLAFQGEMGVVYRYSGIRHEASSWTPSVSRIKVLVETQLGLKFNAVLGNLYRNGHDSLGWHCDDEKELGPDPSIAIVSLGATRHLEFRTAVRQPPLRVEMKNGSLILLEGPIQAHWKHRVPKANLLDAPRTSLSFRTLGTGP